MFQKILVPEVLLLENLKISQPPTKNAGAYYSRKKTIIN